MTVQFDYYNFYFFMLKTNCKDGSRLSRPYSQFHCKGGSTPAALTVVTSKGGWCSQPPLQWTTVRAAGVEPPLQWIPL